MRLYNEGQKRIFAELNIIEIIRKFRHLKSLLKNHDLKKLEDDIQKQNIIDLDEESDY